MYNPLIVLSLAFETSIILNNSMLIAPLLNEICTSFRISPNFGVALSILANFMNIVAPLKNIWPLLSSCALQLFDTCSNENIVQILLEFKPDMSIK